MKVQSGMRRLPLVSEATTSGEAGQLTTGVTVVTGPPGFEPGSEAPEASVMSKLYYGPALDITAQSPDLFVLCPRSDRFLRSQDCLGFPHLDRADVLKTGGLLTFR